MQSLVDHPRGRATPSMLLSVLGCLVFGAIALVMVTPTGISGASAQRPPVVTFMPTFAEASASLRAGRAAEAYGRFVALADTGDVDAARIALLLYRFGPSVFGSRWDASTQQLATWTQWSQAAEDRDLAHLVQRPARCPPGALRR